MSKNSVPIVSVIMPAYNAEKYIGKAIESILNQSYEHFEFIIINDGSSDRTKDIVRSFKDKRIIYLENEKNSGICFTLNRGLDIARGKYIARMDSDDISLSNRFEVQVDFLEKHPDIAICGATTEIFGENIKSYEFEFISDPDSCAAGLIFNPCFAHPTVMWRSKIMKENNLRYDEACKGFEDFKLWWEFAKIGKLTNLSQPLLRYRIHASQETKNVSNEVKKALSSFTSDRFKSFDIILSYEEKKIIEKYSQGLHYLFDIHEIEIFIHVFTRLCSIDVAKIPIKTTIRAIRVTATKSIAYILINSISSKMKRAKLMTEAFINKIVPFKWYLKYLIVFIIK